MFANSGPGTKRALEDAHADEVARQQVRRELDALPRAVDRRGDRLREARLADARHVLDQQVTLCEQRDERELHDLPLAVHDLRDVGDDGVEEGGERRALGALGA
jgi:hypothetical protein